MEKMKITKESFYALVGVMTQIGAMFQKSGTIVAGFCCFSL
jgi:hypothetical protein